MAAHRDGGESRESSRRAVIWRLPTTGGADATASAEADRPRRRRPPWPAIWGLVAALVIVGLYAAWSAVGEDMWATMGEPETQAPATPAAEGTAQAGAGGEGAEASGAPPGDAAPAPLVTAEEDAEADPPESAAAAVGAEADAPPSPRDGSAPAAGAAREEEAEPPPDAVQAATTPAPEPSESKSTAAGGGPEATPPSADAQDEEAKTSAAAPSVTEDAVAASEADVDPRQTAPDAAMLGALAARLDALEAQAAAGSMGAGASVTALAQRVSALESDPGRLELDRALAAWAEQRAALETALAEQGARLAQVEEEAARRNAADGRLVALVLATGELTGALGSSRPFAPTLETIRGIAVDDTEIEDTLARLAPFAATGVPTLDGLSVRFPEVANAIVRAASAGDDADWIDETVTKLSQLVTIRRTGGAIDPESLDGRLAEAERALAAAELGRAIALVEASMTAGTEAGPVAAWLGGARARHEADAALADLVATVHGRIGARWAQGGAPP